MFYCTKSIHKFNSQVGELDINTHNLFQYRDPSIFNKNNTCVYYENKYKEDKSYMYNKRGRKKYKYRGKNMMPKFLKDYQKKREEALKEDEKIYCKNCFFYKYDFYGYF